ncbi:MAG: SDR family oxidoreductase [Spirochaetia bacterium]|jgi:NAD(P)-dependent dehydrogenase (short-subunit alcohol dehydrogenase family)
MKPLREAFDFSGKAVLVTGASGVLGAGIARVFAESGALLFLGYREGKEKAEALRRTLPHPERHFCLQADGTDQGSVQACVDEIAGAVRRAQRVFSTLINNAGIYPVAPLADLDADRWRAVVDANLTATHFFTRAASGIMGPGAAIINIASTEAHRPVHNHAHYAAAKAAVLHYTRASALELAGSGIRVNSVSPGLIQREGLEQAWPSGYRRFVAVAPLGRTGQPEEIGAACLFLASEAAAWITGADLLVDGGVSLSSAQDPLIPWSAP